MGLGIRDIQEEPSPIYKGGWRKLWEKLNMTDKKITKTVTKDIYKDLLVFMVQWLPSEKVVATGYDGRFQVNGKYIGNDKIAEEYNKYVDFRTKLLEIINGL